MTNAKTSGCQYGISVGRRQPMHIMHLECLREILARNMQLFVVIGSHNTPENPYYDPLNNPLTYAQQVTQLTQACAMQDISPPQYFGLADLGNSVAWCHTLAEELRTRDIDPGTTALHVRVKQDAVQRHADIAPLSQMAQSLANEGMALWISSNNQPEEDAISATTYRTMPVDDRAFSGNRSLLATPDYLVRIAYAAREANPDHYLLQHLPVTLLDLTLMRLYNECGTTTHTITHGTKATTIDALYHMIDTHIKS